HVFHVKRCGTQTGRRAPSILRVDRRPCPQWIVIAKVHTKVNGSCERQQHRDPAGDHLSPILRRHACIAEPQFCPALTIRSQRKGSDASAEVAHGEAPWRGALHTSALPYRTVWEDTVNHPTAEAGGLHLPPEG